MITIISDDPLSRQMRHSPQDENLIQSGQEYTANPLIWQLKDRKALESSHLDILRRDQSPLARRVYYCFRSVPLAALIAVIKAAVQYFLL